MTDKERKERDRLHNLWMSGKATKKQMLRAMELDDTPLKWGSGEEDTDEENTNNQ